MGLAYRPRSRLEIETGNWKLDEIEDEEEEERHETWDGLQPGDSYYACLLGRLETIRHQHGDGAAVVPAVDPKIAVERDYAASGRLL